MQMGEHLPAESLNLLVPFIHVILHINVFVEDKLAIIVNLFCVLLINYVNSLNSSYHISPLCINSVLIFSALVRIGFTT